MVHLVAVPNRLTAAVGSRGGKVESTEEHEGRLAEAWMKCQGDIHVFAVHIWHSEGWSVRNEECRLS